MGLLLFLFTGADFTLGLVVVGAGDVALDGVDFWFLGSRRGW